MTILATTPDRTARILTDRDHAARIARRDADPLPWKPTRVPIPAALRFPSWDDVCVLERESRRADH